MNLIEQEGFWHFILRVIRYILAKLGIVKPVTKPAGIVYDCEKANHLISKLMNSNKPCMIARFGNGESSIIANYLGVRDDHKSIFRFVTYKMPKYWWSHIRTPELPTEDDMKKYSKMCLEDMTQLDLLGAWSENEGWFMKYGYLKPNVLFVGLLMLEPWWSTLPWSQYLEDKRVLVIHMFKDTIEEQYYNHREQLFKNGVLPKFKSLRIIKSLFWQKEIEEGRFKDYFQCIDYVKQQMDMEPYDIALIGCGIMGFNLAAYSKATGHKAVHLGGALQLLFGIKGHRWEDPNYGPSLGKRGRYVKELFNESWVYPKDSDVNLLSNIEDSCYIKKNDTYGKLI